MSRKLKIWSCKINRPDTLKSHRSLDAATKKAGDYGFVYDPDTDTVFLVQTMSNGTLKRFNTNDEPVSQEIGGFDMRAAMKEFDIPMASTQVTKIIDGVELTLTEGQNYIAFRPFATSDVVDEKFDISIKLNQNKFKNTVHVVRGLSYEKANSFLLAFNNSKSTFQGVVW
ncbi:MAG: hypothetical protein QM500_12200 [Methylococcales bacterium]